MAARLGDGWVLPASPGEGLPEFTERRSAILRELEAVDRDPATFSFAGQLPTGTTAADRAAALEVAQRFVAAGADQVILGMPARLGPAGLTAVAREVAEPLREAIG
jgi:alkanesulfonate monooxygenase SsuD/methylene tetrahydromethanopterin reductase-like flavin-dependent oxidoreductase (luciferase family)